MVQRLLLLQIAAALVCGGIHIAGRPRMLLHRWWKVLADRVDRGLFPETLAKPLWLCYPCMASIWGTLTYWGLSWGLGWLDQWRPLLVYYPVMVLGTVLLNTLSSSVLLHMDKLIEDAHAKMDQELGAPTGDRPAADR